MNQTQEGERGNCEIDLKAQIQYVQCGNWRTRMILVVLCDNCSPRKLLLEAQQNPDSIRIETETNPCQDIKRG